MTPGSPRSRAPRARFWSPPLPLVIASVLAGLWVTVDVIVGGPWLRLDVAVADWVDRGDLRAQTVPNALLWLLAQTGGRGTILVVVGLLTLWTMLERRVWQPALRVLVAFVLLTVTVYALKIGLGRTAPGYGASVLYVEGRSYPSGHSVNVVLWWGLVVWMLRAYAMPAWSVRVFTTVAVAAPVLTTLSMVLLNYHWLTDMIAGLAVGVLLLWALHQIVATGLGQWGDVPRPPRPGGRTRARVHVGDGSPASRR